MERRFSHPMALFMVLGLFAAFLLTFAAEPAWSQETPIGDKWWPSQWGPDDERGAVNRITPAKVLQAAGMIKEGKIYRLGKAYESGIPLFGARHYSLTIPGLPTGGPFGTNSIVWNDEMISGELGQIGTQFDGLGHIGVKIGSDEVFYNGFKLQEFGTTYGLGKIGVEKLGPYVTRGVLVDIAGCKGVEMLDKGQIVTVAEVKDCLKKEGVAEPGEGDVFVLRTGWGNLWMKDNAKFNSGEPGWGMELAKYLIERKISMTASDTWAGEAVPGDDPDRPFEAHQWLIAKNGITNLENCNLEDLARDKVYEFTFIYIPVPFKGATGSPGEAIAIK